MVATYMQIFCRISIAVLFFFSFWSKIRTVRDFAVTIADFKLLPRRWSKPVAILFLGGEIAAVLLLTVGADLLPIGFLLAMALLIIFSTALITALSRNLNTRCNCFGRTERRISRYDVVRNIILILCCVAGLWTGMYPLLALSSGEILLLALMSAGMLTFVTNLEDIIETLRQPFPVYEERR